MENLKVKAYILDINSVSPEVFEKYYQNIKEYRKEKIDRLQFDKDKLLSLGAEILLQRACKDFDVDYQTINVKFEKHGKPYLDNVNMFYNVSHSGNKTVLIASNYNVGIDIQEMREAKFDIASRFFTPRETKLINEDKCTFYKIWALKEAILKCLGDGLTKPLNSIDLAENNYLVNEVVVNDNTYKVTSKIFENYSLAVAIQTDEELPEIELEEVEL